MIKPHQKNIQWFAYMSHRLSGLALAIFLPVHFYVLGLALNDTAALNGFLHWAERPLVKLAEMGLVFLLAVHFFGGIRILALELLPWTNRQKTLMALGVAGSFLVACGFGLGAI